MERVAELTARMVSQTGYVPGRQVAVRLYFPFRSRRSDVDGPIKRTIDAVQKGFRAVDPGSKWDDRNVEKVSAERVHKEHPFIVVFENLPDEGCPARKSAGL